MHAIIATRNASEELKVEFMSRLKHLADRLLVAAFLVVIAAPMWFAFRSDNGGTIAATERRAAAPFPKLDFRDGHLLPRKRSITAFPQKFELWFNDHLGFRRALIQGYNMARVAGLVSNSAARPVVGQAPRSPVIIGRDGWLFYSAENLVDDYRCTRPFTAAELDYWKKLLTDRRDWLRKRGIRYIVTVAPNSQTINSEFMPRSFNRVHPQSRLDQLLAHLRGPDAVEIVDLREALREARTQFNTYHKTDTHWNDFGAFVGYRQLMQRLAGWYPQLEPWALDDFAVTKIDAPGDYLSRLVDSPIPFREELITLEPRRQRQAEMPAYEIAGDRLKTRVATRPEGELDAIVVLHDSFTVALAPFLNEHARRVRYLWTFGFPAEVIEAESPQIVIQEFVERVLMAEPPKNPPELEAFEPLAGREAGRRD